MRTFGETMRLVMDAKGLKPVDLWRDSDILTQPYISKLLTNRVVDPTFNKACAIIDRLGMRLEDVERAEYHSMTLAVAHVRRQVTSDARVSEALKTRASARPLVIPEPWSLRLLELADEARERGDVWLTDDGIQRPVSQNAYRRAWADACRLAGVEAKQPRAARRSWETYMRWDMRVEQSRVEQLMGHVLPGVTGTHYDKPTTQMFVEVVGEAFERRPFVSGESATGV